MRLSLCLLMALFFTLNLHAQEVKTIRGQVLDKDSRFPIMGANVLVVGSNPPIGAVTDDQGFFKIDVPLGRVSLRVSYIGYQDAGYNELLVIAGKESNLTIDLQEKVSQIGEVVVSGKKDEGRAKNEFATVSARSFDVEQTSKFSGNRNDPARMASNFAGVSGANDARNDIIIRGNSPLGLLWRLEGIDIPNPNHFGGFGSTGGPVSMLNNNTLSRGDFFTSAFPAEYGDALSGVFDLGLRNGNKDKYEFMAQVGFNGIEAGAEGPFSKKSGASFMINYRYSTLGFFKLLHVNFGTGTAVPEYQDLTFKIDIPTKKAGTFRIWGIGGLDKIALLGSESDTSAGSGSLYGNENENLTNKVQTGMVGFSHTYFITHKSYYKLMVGASTQTQRADIDSVDYVHRDVTAPTERVKLRENKYSAHVMYNNKINTKNTFTAGVIGNVYDVRFSDSILWNNTFIPIKNGYGASALIEGYAMWQHKFTDQFSLNVGAHLQYFTLSKSFAPEPRIGVKYQLSETQFISFGYGLHHQIQPLPTYYNRDTASGPNGPATNLNIGFTRSQHLVFGYDLMFLRSFHLKTEIYMQLIDHAPVEQIKSSFSMLNAGADFATPNNNYLVNKGLGANYGLEITLEKFFSKGYYFLVTTSLFQSQYTGSDGVWRNTAFNGGYVVNALGGYEYRFGGKKDKTKRNSLAIDLKMTGAGGRYYTPVDVAASAAQHQEVLLDSKAFTQKYKDYFRMDLKLSYRISFKKITQEFSTDFQNIFNIKNIFVKVYDPRTNTLVNEYQQGLFILPQYRILF